jgi:hypothetical protein
MRDLLLHAWANKYREHLVKEHVIALRCSICEINLSSQNELEIHCGNESCRSREERPVEGINYFQKQKIEQCVISVNRSTETESSTVGKWFEIWRILFPSSTPPDTPCKFSDTDHRNIGLILEQGTCQD